MGDDLEVRPVGEDEFEAVLEVASTAFGEELTPEDAAAWSAAFPFERSLAAYEGGRMVSTSAVFSMELTVPGGLKLPMAGVTWIATLPTHRRRGILRRLLEKHSLDMTERGECLAGLGASEGVIYGRFGYGPASSLVSFTIERVHSQFHEGWSPSGDGRLTLLAPKEASTRLPGIYESVSHEMPGTVSRPDRVWRAFFADPPSERDGASRMLYVVHETVAGEPDGYAAYRVKEDWRGASSHNDVRVVEVVAADPGTYAALWRYLLDTDLAKTVTCPRGRVDDPLRWLLADTRRMTVTDLYDFLWLRLHDVPRALAGRRYASEGALVMEVTDPFPTPTTARYLLEAANGRRPGPAEAFPHPATCAKTTATPDLALDAETLAAAYLGGTTFAALASSQRVRELTPGAVARADAMFVGGQAPFCATEF